MQFPTFVYRKHERGTFTLFGVGPVRFVQVHDDGELAEALKAEGAFTWPICDDTAPIDETSPPTRAELLIKAKELGLTFHHKTGDAKLAAMIEEALS